MTLIENYSFGSCLMQSIIRHQSLNRKLNLEMDYNCCWCCMFVYHALNTPFVGFSNFSMCRMNRSLIDLKMLELMLQQLMKMGWPNFHLCSHSTHLVMRLWHRYLMMLMALIRLIAYCCRRM